MKIIQLIEEGLKQNGFDGLVNPGLCGCLIGDISPAGCLSEHCAGGYKHTHSVTGDWITSRRKDRLSDDEIQRCLDDCA